ncbi:MAG TPA: porin [Magnetospirillaceae bacterium]|jgi:predicted porin
MKKILLLGASALAVGVGASAAYADDPLKVTLSGTGQEWFGYAANNKSDVGNISKTFAQSNNSFSLNGSTKLDNGITVGVSFTMNASPGLEGSQAHLNTAGGALNQTSYAPQTGAPETNIVTFAGGFGSIDIGWQPNAAETTALDGPSFGVGGLTWGRWAGWIVGPTGNNLTAGSGLSAIMDDYWANKVLYASPTIAGFQATASFTPNMASQDFGATTTNGTSLGNWGGDSSSYALTYAGDFGATKIKAQAAYTNEEFNGQPQTTGTIPANAPLAGQGGTVNGYQAGFSASMAGFTLGGAIADREVSGATGALSAYDLKTALAQGVTWDVGLSYTTGPWGVAASYFTSQADNNNLTLTANGKETDNYYGVSFQYTLGPGITLDLENAYVDYKVDTAPTSTTNGKNNGVFSVLSTTVNF